MKRFVYIVCLDLLSPGLGHCQNAVPETAIPVQKEKPSLAPVIAFSIVGAVVGMAVGAWVDPAEKNELPGEMHVDVSLGGTIGLFLGGITGGYLGYRLAKHDLRRSPTMEATQINQVERVYLQYVHFIVMNALSRTCDFIA